MSPDVLLAGSVGALAVFVLGIAREWWRNERERRGLLRLLIAEIEHNAQLFSVVYGSRRQIYESPMFDEGVESPEIQALTTEAWRATRTRAAQVVNKEQFDVLVMYYSHLEALLSITAHMDRIDRWIAAGYDPEREYLAPTWSAQEQARQVIAAHLERPWGELLVADVLRWLERQLQRQRRDQST